MSNIMIANGAISDYHKVFISIEKLNMYKFTLLALMCFCHQICAEHKHHKINPLAPAQTAQYAPLLGEWSITDESIDKEGNWKAGPGADWNWYTILDGHAIQDDWIQPSLSKDVPAGKRQYGTNIRIFNPAKKQWDQIWTSNSSHKFDTFKAIGDGQEVVMRGFYAGAETRVTFYNLKADSFDWKMEQQSKKDPSQWNEVYRIHGVRKK